TYRGAVELDERVGAEPQQGENPLARFRSPNQRFSVEGHLARQAMKLRNRFDAGSYVTLTDALNRHDLGRGRGGMNAALGNSTVPRTGCGSARAILYRYH